MLPALLFLPLSFVLRGVTGPSPQPQIQFPVRWPWPAPNPVFNERLEESEYRALFLSFRPRSEPPHLSWTLNPPPTLIPRRTSCRPISKEPPHPFLDESWTPPGPAAYYLSPFMSSSSCVKGGLALLFPYPLICVWWSLRF